MPNVCCTNCKASVSITAKNCPYCNARPFLPCKVCGKPRFYNYNHMCDKHQSKECYYCKKPVYICDGYENYLVKWVWERTPYNHTKDWQSVETFVCRKCAKDKKYRHPKKPRWKKFWGFS